ncbi:MAG TPA: hypothetical protein VJT81_17375 [Burkholderiales bacterium]|nr:hypothetical protein [Burkholderiales bacterium]
MMGKLWREVVIGTLIGGLASAAYACGYCIEDKIAAVYDHAVVMRAASQKHQVVFFALEGQIPAGEESRRTLEAVVESVAGVDKGSARVSVAGASLSAAFNPRRTAFASMERSLSRKLAPRGLTVAIMRVMDQPAELKPVGKR